MNEELKTLLSGLKLSLKDNHSLQNGWTKERMMSTIREKSRGKCTREDGLCIYYRDSDRNRCVAGAFIPDSLIKVYATKQEMISGLMDADPRIQEAMPLDSFGMAQLQCIHDNMSPDATPEKFYEAYQLFIDHCTEESESADVPPNHPPNPKP